MNKLRGILSIIIFFIMLIVSCGNVGNASTDERGNIYSTGSSVSNGSPGHDSIHSTRGGSDDVTNSYQYWFDQYMLSDYGIQTNLSDWYANVTYQSSWDKYSIGTGGGQTNNEGGEGSCSLYPYCCHCPPTKVADGEDAMYMACIPAQIDGVYGRSIWRYKGTHWSDINFLIVEAGINEAMDQAYGVNYRASVWSGMNGIYNRSLTYGFKFVLLKTLPYDTYVYGYGNQALGQSFIDAVNQEKDKFATLHPDIIYIDTFNTSMVTWLVPYTSWNYNPTYFYDTVHPNKAGYQLMAQTIVDELGPYILGYIPSPSVGDTQFVSIGGGGNGTEIYNSTPVFVWDETTDTAYYNLQISSTSAFLTLVVNITKINEYEYPSNCVIENGEVAFTFPTGYSLNKGVWYCRVVNYR